MKKSYINVKPARVFDAIFDTHMAQDYIFPFRLSADEVWKIYIDTDYGREKLNIIIDNINFPYIDLKTLTSRQRLDVLMGMASCINSDDILWYIAGNYACSPDSMVIDMEMRQVLGNHVVQNYIGWVISRTTCDRLKEQLSVLI